VSAPGRFGQRFFGDRFNVEDVRSFTPDIAIDRHTEVKIGGTRIEFIPVQGGETNDALFIHLPDYGVTFVGDFIMPYLGAPFSVYCREETKSENIDEDAAGAAEG
jgi:hypothetical protein